MGVPVTPNACLQGGVAPGLGAPTSPPVYSGGTQVGYAPRVLPSPPPPLVQAVGDRSAWSYARHTAIHHMQHKLLKCKLCLQVLE